MYILSQIETNLPIYNMEWMNEITGKVEEVFNDYVNFFKGQESTSKVLLSSECRVPNISETKTYGDIAQRGYAERKGH